MRLTPTELQGLKSGVPAVVDSLILRYIPLANKVAGRFAFRFRRLRDDIRAVAYLSLVGRIWKAVSKLKDDNIEPYLWVSIRGDIMKFLKTQRKHPETMTPDYLAETIAVGHTIDRMQLKETLTKVLNSPREEKVARLLMLGYNDFGIAQELGITTSGVRQIRKRIKDRVLAILEN